MALGDLDAQANATLWVGAEPEKPGVIELLTGEEDAHSLSRNTKVDGLDVIPATKRMTGVDKIFQQMSAGEKYQLREALDLEFPSWKHVFIDCPANFGLVTVNAMVAADELIVPVEASDMAVDGAVDLLTVFNDVRKYHNENLSIAGLLVCRVDHRTNHSEDVINTLREKLGGHVFETTITQNVAVQDSYRHETPTVIDAPRATASKEYKELAREIL